MFQIQGVQLMKEMIRLSHAFNTATTSRKRQFQALSDTISLLKQVDASDCHQKFTEEVIQLQASTKHGTFEWIESVLCRALKEGSWLVIDHVNLCSASVLDRLNALFERGGVLTVSERGVLDGTVPEVRPHPDFRVFLVYDPSRGDISRAMRNRGVEIYIPSEMMAIMPAGDLMGLTATCLGPAAGSQMATAAALATSLKTGIKKYTESLSVLGLQTLSGCELKQEDNVFTVPSITSRLCWWLTSSQVWSLFPKLAAICYQLLPVLELATQPSSEDRQRLAFNYFVSFLSQADSTLRQQVSFRTICVQWNGRLSPID